MGVVVPFSHLCQRPDVARRHRVLDPQQLVGRQRRAQAQRRRHVEGAVAVHGEVNVRADRLAHRRHHLRHLPEIGRREGAVEAPRRRNRLVHVHFERPEALRDGRTRHRGVFLLDVPRAPEEAVHVHRDLSAALPAEQVVDRLAGGLTDDVPERRLDPAQGRRVQPAAVQRLPVQLDLEGVFPYKVLRRPARYSLAPPSPDSRATHRGRRSRRPCRPRQTASETVANAAPGPATPALPLPALHSVLTTRPSFPHPLVIPAEAGIQSTHKGYLYKGGAARARESIKGGWAGSRARGVWPDCGDVATISEAG